MVLVIAINLMGAGERLHLIQNHASGLSYTHTIGIYGEAEFIFAQVLILHFI
jgi:hypothetical protein